MTRNWCNQNARVCDVCNTGVHDTSAVISVYEIKIGRLNALSIFHHKKYVYMFMNNSLGQFRANTNYDHINIGKIGSVSGKIRHF